MKNEYEIQKEIDRIKTINLATTIKNKNKNAEAWIRGYWEALSWVLED